MWLQELRPHLDVPDECQRGTVDTLGLGLYLGAMKHADPIWKWHTIALWWNRQTFPLPTRSILKELTGLERPGSLQRTILWTTNPQHRVLYEHPRLVDEVSTRDLMMSLHLLNLAQMINPTPAEFRIMKRNVRAVIEDAFSGMPYLDSLEIAGVYDCYAKEILE